MNSTEFIMIALKSIRANKLRSLLTILGVIIGVASVILLTSIGTGLQAFVTAQFASLGSNKIFVLPGKIDFKSSSRGLLPTSKFEFTDVSDLERSGEAIRQVTPATIGNGTILYRGETVPLEVIGIWEEYLPMQNFTLSKGRSIVESDVERSRKVVVLGAKPVAELFETGENPVGKHIVLNDIRFEVVGTLAAKGSGGALGSDIDNHAFIPLSTALKLYDQTKPYMLLIEARDQDSVSSAVEQIKKILLTRLKNDDFTVLEQTELLGTITQFLGVITIALGGIASISLVVGGIGIMNIMLVSVTERTREIGLRKAVGATPFEILFQFLMEAVMLSVTGGIIGIMLGSLGAYALGSFIETSVEVWSVFLAFGFSTLVGIIFGVAPAIKASRLSPIVALRYE